MQQIEKYNMGVNVQKKCGVISIVRQFLLFKTPVIGTSPVAQWLRIRLPRQGTRVQALVREDPTCRGATKPECHNY